MFYHKEIIVQYTLYFGLCLHCHLQMKGYFAFLDVFIASVFIITYNISNSTIWSLCRMLQMTTTSSMKLTFIHNATHKRHTWKVNQFWNYIFYSQHRKHENYFLPLPFSTSFLLLVSYFPKFYSSCHTSQLVYALLHELVPPQLALVALSDRSPDLSLDKLCSSNCAHVFVYPVQLQKAIFSDWLGLTTMAQTPKSYWNIKWYLENRWTHKITVSHYRTAVPSCALCLSMC